jgi:hypothetical protein
MAMDDGDGFQLQQLQHGGRHERYNDINLPDDDVFHGNDSFHLPALHLSVQR